MAGSRASGRSRAVVLACGVVAIAVLVSETATSAQRRGSPTGTRDAGASGSQKTGRFAVPREQAALSSSPGLTRARAQAFIDADRRRLDYLP